MTSEIKVDTISEQTSANGVTIDGLTIKDGNIQGSPALVGTTPSFTIGDGGAEDTKIVFDGNALDYYIGLDDSADNLIIGSGSTVGSNSLITIDSDGDFTLDSAGDIILDADGADVSFRDGGTGHLSISNSSNDAVITSLQSDKDMIFKGVDGGALITALTLDMSDAGTALFNHNIKLNTDDGFLSSGASDDFLFVHDGTDSKIFNSTGDLIIDNSASDKDLIFKGSDGGSTVTALTLDMSAAGAATFNSSIVTTGILNKVNDSLLMIGGGNATNVGSNLTMYGGADGSAGLFRFRNATTVTANVTATGQIQAVSQNPASPTFAFTTDTDTGMTRPTSDTLTLVTNGTERVRILSDGRFLVGKTSSGLANAGVELFTDNLSATVSAATVMYINRLTNDGTLVQFHQAGTEEGSIEVSGSTVSFNGFTGSHWSRLADNSKPTILRGTIMDSIDEMCDWYQAVADVAEVKYTAEDEEVIDGLNNVGDVKMEAHKIVEPITLPNGKSVGDDVTFTSNSVEYTGTIIKEDDVKHTKSKVSDTADSKKVYGVFSNWDDADDGLDGDVNDMNIAQVGTYIIRVHKDVTVAAGDLLVSNGDGTAKLQDDDIIRSKTVAKVNSNVKVETYSDGSYTVPCTLHC